MKIALRSAGEPLRMFAAVLAVLLIPCAAFSAERLTVRQDGARAGESGRVVLEYTVVNGDGVPVSALDLAVADGIELEKVAVDEGWAVVGRTDRTARILPGAALRPGGSGQIGLTVKVRGEGPNLFQVRRPGPLLTITALFVNGEKAGVTIQPPFIRAFERGR